MLGSLVIGAFSVFMLLGLALVFIPFAPALPFMLLVAILAKISNVGITWVEVGVLGSLLVLSLCVDWGMGILGAKWGGAHIRSLLFGILGACIGFFVFPPFGAIAGLFLFVLLSEMRYKKDASRALVSAGSAVLGSVIGIGINFFLAIVFFALFIFFILS